MSKSDRKYLAASSLCGMGLVAYAASGSGLRLAATARDGAALALRVLVGAGLVVMAFALAGTVVALAWTGVCYLAADRARHGPGRDCLRAPAPPARVRCRCHEPEGSNADG